MSDPVQSDRPAGAAKQAPHDMIRELRDRSNDLGSLESNDTTQAAPRTTLTTGERPYWIVITSTEGRTYAPDPVKDE